MGERELTGAPASPGVAIGPAWRRPEEAGSGERVPAAAREHQRQAAVDALERAAHELIGLAAELGGEEAEIVETGALMGQDPMLIESVERAVLDDGLDAAGAILRATADHAEVIAAIGDETLAARADDVRSLGRRAARLAAGSGRSTPPGEDVILLADDLGPADVAEMAARLAGVALAGGGPTAHAAIVARSLGVPMVTGLGPRLQVLAGGDQLVIDGSRGTVIADPSAGREQAARDEMLARRRHAERALELCDEPAVTEDGRRVKVLANVGGAGELELGLRAGAEGIGLLRTELAFLDAERWPSEQEHTDMLARALAGLGSRPAVVRVLDFGADKSPPFLRAEKRRGLELLLAHPDEFLSQLRAIVLAADRHDIRILLPMVQTPEHVISSRGLIDRVAASLSLSVPPLGAMIETPSAAQAAPAIAELCEFLSVGTNDLTAATLGADRFAMNDAVAHDPRVLRSISDSVSAAHAAGIAIEVCGEAASDPIMVPLLVGLGVDELSVGAARVGSVRARIRRLDAAECGELAGSALGLGSAADVESGVRPVAAALEADSLLA
jgi:phosphoenolpyruvate-protein kinase (PTS system EI component)